MRAVQVSGGREREGVGMGASLARCIGVFGSAVLVAMTAMTGACSSSTSSSAASTDVTIAWIPKEVNNPVFDLGKQGAFRAASDLSSSTGRKVSVLYLGPDGSNATEKVDSQIALVQQAVSQKVSAISISCNDA